MKKINYLLILFTLSIFVVSCELDSDNNLAIADTAGMIINVDESSGKVLGVPTGSDLATSDINFTDVDLNFDARLNLGDNDGVLKYELLKSLNGGTEVSLGETPSLPFNITYSTIEEYVSGLGVDASDLRIGDVFTFKVRLHQADGDVYDFNPGQGQFSVVINCSSDLVGSYYLTVVRDNGVDVIFPNEMITEVSPGFYKTESIYRWDVGSIAPDQGFNFLDVCGTISVPDQGLAQGFYSNAVYETEPGIVDGATGIITIKYAVDFASGPVTCVGTYVPN